MYPVIRSTTDKDYFAYGKHSVLNNQTTINNEIVLVRCLSRKRFKNKEIRRLRLEEQKYNTHKTKFFKNYEILYEYVHFIFKIKNPVKYYENNNSSKMNVLFLILDGVSLSSMKRALPKTLKLLNSYKDFFLFEKQHVIGENTFQNIVPMLTNIDSAQILGENSQILLTKPFDEYPFIWKNFSERYMQLIIFFLFVE